MDIVDQDVPTKFQGLHWELLDSTLSTPEIPFIVRRRATKRGNPGSNPNDKLKSKVGAKEARPNRKRYLNILIVVSRPFKATDVNPLICIEAILDARENAKSSGFGTDMPIDIEISRPGTWHAFVTLMEKRSREWHESGGEGAWYDLVHFDCHGLVKDGNPSLLFLSRNGKKALQKSAQDIARCLVNHLVHFAVLHACNSAEDNEAVTSNLTRLLVEAGLSAAIGMKYAFTSSAARIFLKEFYTSLFTDPLTDLGRAVGAARAKLRSDMKRLSRSLSVVELPDFVLPVLYYRDSTRVLSPSLVHSTEAVRSSETDAPLRQPLIERVAGWAPPIGREQDLVELEWLLLRSEKQKVAHLSGSVGIGKTALAGFAGTWWSATGSIANVLTWDFKKQSLPSSLDDLMRPVSNHGRASLACPDLLILDHLDAIMHVSSVFQEPLSDSQKSELNTWIHAQDGRRVRILLISRSEYN